MGRKVDSVWHNFRGNALDVMRQEARARHPGRAFVDRLMRNWFGSSRFDWLDVGVVGMVDYERLRPRMGFRFTGSDLSESIADDSRRYLARPDDRIVVWDIEDPPDGSLIGRFDLVTLRHVLNHCEYYEAPLRHAAMVLRPGGRVVVVLHLHLSDGPDRLERHRRWSVEGEVIGNVYNRERFLAAFASEFEPLLWVRLDDGRKPNDVIAGRKPVDGVPPRGARPTMRRLWIAPGRRNAPRRWVSSLLYRVTERLRAWVLR